MSALRRELPDVPQITVLQETSSGGSDSDFEGNAADCLQEPYQTEERTVEIMTQIDDKELGKRDSMPFAFRWFDTLTALSDADMREFLTAIGKFAREGISPDFDGVKAALWIEIADRIKHDKENYQKICERRCQSGMKGAISRWKDHDNGKNGKCYFEMAKMADGDGDGDGEGDGDIKERTLSRSKEKALPSSLPRAPGEPIHYSEWSEGRFREEVSKYPEFAYIADRFIDYWIAPAKQKGKMLFQTEKSWSTKSRLQTWQSRCKDGEIPKYKPDDGKDDFAMEEE